MNDGLFCSHLLVSHLISHVFEYTYSYLKNFVCKMSSNNFGPTSQNSVNRNLWHSQQGSHMYLDRIVNIHISHVRELLHVCM